MTTTYRYNNGMLLSETTGDETIYYYYDSTGKVTEIGYQKGSDTETGYFFTRNAQGDIIGIYRNSDSKLIGTYEYDLWGRPISVKEAEKGIDRDGILTKNPLRYRGYYYDNETGFYYLNARYYDPEIRRFISADSLLAGVGDSVQGHNLFAYCLNNPVNMADPSGNWPQSIKNKVKSTAKNVIRPAIKFVQDTLSEVDATYSGGINITGTPSIFIGDIMGCISVDTKGDVAIQGSFMGGVTGSAPGVSITAYQSATNAPSIDNLQGMGYQFGGTAGIPVYGVPLAVGGDLNIIPDAAQNYFGITGNIGFGTPGGELHIEWGGAKTWDATRFNIFEVTDEVYNIIMEW